MLKNAMTAEAKLSIGRHMTVYLVNMDHGVLGTWLYPFAALPKLSEYDGL